MRTITRSNIYLPMAALILAALAAPAAAQEQVPFKGAMQGHDTDTGFTNTTVTVLTVGTGIGSHFGSILIYPNGYGSIRDRPRHGLLSGSRPMETASLRQLPARVK
jgi:hypothetical protein